MGISFHDHLATVKANLTPGKVKALSKAVSQALKTGLPKSEIERSKALQGMDTNHDGRVTRDELTRGLLGTGNRSSYDLADLVVADLKAGALMRSFDLDGDGAIAVDPLPGTEKRQFDQAMTLFDRFRDAPPSKPDLTQQEQAAARHLRRLDRDGDGQITRKELRQATGSAKLAAQLMRRFDRDQDGVIDLGT